MCEKELTIKIRSPSLEETLPITIKTNATISSLKQVIQLSHPQQPACSDQRIIYSGRLLEDTELIHTVISKANSDVAPTFHLVLKPSSKSANTTTLPTSSSKGPPISSPANPSISSPANPSISSPANPSISSPTNPPTSSPTSLPTLANQTMTQQPMLHDGYHLVAINGQYFLMPVLVPNTPTQPQTNTPTQPNLFLRWQTRPIQMSTVWLVLKLFILLFMLCQGANVWQMILYHLLALLFFTYQTGRLAPLVHRFQTVITTRHVQNADEPTFWNTCKRGLVTFVASLWPAYGTDPRIAQAFDNN